MGISCVSLQDLQLKEKVTEQMIFASAEEITEDRFRVALNENESLESDCGLIILGDFNNLNSTRVRNALNTASNKLSRFQPADQGHQAISTLSSQI